MLLLANKYLDPDRTRRKNDGLTEKMKWMYRHVEESMKKRLQTLERNKLSIPSKYLH